MTRGDARDLAERLMARHGLRHWQFDFDNARRRLGSCDYVKRRITLSRHLIALNPVDKVQDTLLHEIAHALTPGDGHGSLWRGTCERLGARPERCAREGEVALPAAPLALVCDVCGRRYPRYRRTRGTYLCGSCGRGKAPGTVLRWEVNHGQSGTR